MCSQLQAPAVLTPGNSSLDKRLGQQHKILSIILPSRLTPYTKEIVGDHQRGFRRNRSTTDYKFCIGQMLEKK
jgi:hypothetical protein